MAKGKKISQDTLTIVEPLPIFRLCCHIRERELLPTPAIDKRYWETILRVKTKADWVKMDKAIFQTLDGEQVRVKFISTCNNRDDYYKDELDSLCKKIYGDDRLDISILKKNWSTIFRGVDDFWHLIEISPL